jgi:hypothetical protein
MKVISIIQPWATLIAQGEKKFETRSWATKYRGELAIHASKKIEKALCKCEPFRSILEKHGYTAANLPTGKILGTVNLAECYEITHASDTFASSINDEGEILEIFEDNEFAFGFYEPGRYAWELQNVKLLKEPIPAKGQLGLWNYPLNV